MRVQVDGADLYAEVGGSASAPALLLWPSGGATLRIWDHLVPRLRERFRVVRFDIRGVGKSIPAATGESQYTLEQYAVDACGVLDHVGIERCHVWSQSWGSRPAIVFAVRHPERVASAALYAANLELPDVPAQRAGSKRAAELQRAAGVERAAPSPGFDVHESPETVPLAMQALRKTDLAAVVDGLTMPLLVGTGDCDPNLASSRVIAGRLQNATLVVFENVGHNAILEHPELALATFLRFHDDLATATG